MGRQDRRVRCPWNLVEHRQGMADHSNTANKTGNSGLGIRVHQGMVINLPGICQGLSVFVVSSLDTLKEIALRSRMLHLLLFSLNRGAMHQYNGQ